MGAAFLRPLDRLVVPAARLVLLSVLPRGHRQEEVIGAIAPIIVLPRFLQGRQRLFRVAGAILRRTQRLPGTSVRPGWIGGRLLRQFDRRCGLAELRVGTGGQQPGEAATTPHVPWLVAPALLCPAVLFSRLLPPARGPQQVT